MPKRQNPSRTAQCDPAETGEFLFVCGRTSHQGSVFSDQNQAKACTVLIPDHCQLITAMVEQDGIEPTTSCLQSTRSPN